MLLNVAFVLIVTYSNTILNKDEDVTLCKRHGFGP